MAVVREPISWLKSWFRYSISTGRLRSELTFPEFALSIANKDAIDGEFINIRSQFERLSDGRQRRIIVDRLMCFDYLGAEYDALNSDCLSGLGAPLAAANVSPRKKAATPREIERLILDHWARDLDLWKAARARAEAKYDAA